ncbi:hypothetical protein BHE74_00016882 [Ensete ventricosum]|nr:hypothetical protein GW17_00025203 [Ensete ventricosum]RWW75115.1 hypothetical protein BHE74_00016882 [Ensete ventricosum]RZR96554.1 hypothetical protein BHM03_00025601 [Ensete ventricosum]
MPTCLRLAVHTNTILSAPKSTAALTVPTSSPLLPVVMPNSIISDSANAIVRSRQAVPNSIISDGANVIIRSRQADKSLVLLQSTGAYKAAARLASATPPPAHVLSRGIGWQVIITSSDQPI